MKNNPFNLLFLKITIFSLAIFGMSESLLAQTTPIQIIWNQGPPYPYIIEDYLKYENEIVGTLINSGTQTLNLRAHVTLTGNNGISIVSDDDAPLKFPYTIGPGAVEQITGRELWDMGIQYDIDEIISKFEITNINPRDIINQKVLPEGDYMMCITILDYVTKAELSNEMCVNGSISHAERPIIVSPPTNDFEVVPTVPSMLPVAWVLPGGLPPMDATLSFTVKIVDLAGLENMNLQDAINSLGSAVVVEESFLEEYSAVLETADLFTIGHEYVMRVTAEDFASPPAIIFQHNGGSELRTFFYGSPPPKSDDCESPILFEAAAVYPQKDDTIPFQRMPFVAKWSPYCNYRSLEVGAVYLSKADGLPIGSFENRDITWAGDDTPALLTKKAVETFNAKAYSDFDTTLTVPELQFFAQHTAVDHPALDVSLTPGEHYDWFSTLTMTTRDHEANIAELAADFTVGMPKPFGIEPPNNDQLPLETNSVSLKWKPGNAPSNPFPPFIVLKADFNGVGGDWVELTRLGPIKERFVVQVVRFSNNFESATNIEFLETGLIEFNKHNTEFQPSRTYEAVRNEFLETLYGQRECVWNNGSTITPGQRFWRIGWQRNPDAIFSKESPPTNDDFYWTSEVQSFWIGDADLPPPPTVEVPCESPCTNPVLENTTASISAKVGDILTVGKFKMKLTEIEFSDFKAKGKGLILDAPWFRAQIKVVFEDIEINAAKQIFSGEVVAEKDPFGEFSAAETNYLAAITGLTDTEIEQFDHFINSETRLVSAILLNQPTSLPLGIELNWDGEPQTIGIMDLVFTAKRAVAQAVAAVNIPNLNGWLAIGGRDICLTPTGPSTEIFELFLPNDKIIGWADDPSSYSFTFEGSMNPDAPRLTRARFKCGKLDEFKIYATTQFARSEFLPIEADFSVKSTGQVAARFDAIWKKKDGFLGKIDMDRFTLTGAPDWAFELNEGWMDFSKENNPVGMVFPDGFPDDKKTDWKGWYLKNLTCFTPKQFKSINDESKRFQFGINNLLKDPSGLWLKAVASDIMPLAEGDMGGWAASLDEVSLSIRESDFEKLELRGQIATPINDTATLLYVLRVGYAPGDEIETDEGTLHRGLRGRISGRVEFPEEGYEMQFFNSKYANLRLLETSFLELSFEQVAGWGIEAELSGIYNMWYVAGNSQSMTYLDSLSFEKMTIKSWGDDKFDWGDWAFSSPQHSLRDFPISIENIGGVDRTSLNGNPEIGLRFDVKLSLDGEMNTFEASTTLTMWAELTLTPRQSYRFSGLSLNAVAVKGEVGPVSIDGQLTFFDRDETFGDGFRGRLAARFLKKFEVEAIAQFGKKDGLRYWMVDGLLMLGSTEIGVFPPALVVKGFGGGAYKNMERVSMPDLSEIQNSDSTGIGIGLSKAVYRPLQSGWGFNVKLVFGPSQKETYRLVGELGASWQNGSIHSIQCNAWLTIMAKDPDSTDAPIKGQANLSWNFTDDIFTGTIATQINMADGRVTGGGTAQLYFSDDKWFIKVGEPQNKIAVNFKMDKADGQPEEANGGGPQKQPPLEGVGFYFMLGDELPDFSDADLPARIRQSLDDEGITLSNQRDGDVANGSGIGLGACIDFPEKKFNFLFLYAAAEIDLGFDLSLKKYENVECQGQTSFGHNGWYARGRIYGYVYGEFGVEVDWGIIEGSFAIGSVGVGAVLTGGLPNPSWVAGGVLVHYSVLGGAFSGSKNFFFKAGKICDPNNTSLANLKLVEQMIPENGSTAVDCGVFPQVIVNLPVNTELQNVITNSDGTPTLQRYRVKFDKTVLEKKNGSTWETVTLSPSGAQVIQNNYTLEYRPKDQLAGNSDFRFSLKIWVEEYVGGQWRKIRKNGVEQIASFASEFQTGPQPTTIRDEDVAQSWPRSRQRFYLQDECRNGFIWLKQGNPNFPTINNGLKWEYTAVFTPISSGATVTAPLTFEPMQPAAPNRLNFQVPTLLNDKTYSLRIMAKGVPLVKNGETTIELVANNSTVRNSLTETLGIMNQSTDGTFDQFRTKKQSKMAVRSIEKQVFKMFFRTSHFQKLDAKMAAVASTTNVETFNSGSIRAHYVGASAIEGYDQYDLRYIAMPGSAGDILRPLMRTQPINATENLWYFSFAQPKIFSFWQTLYDCCREKSLPVCLGCFPPRRHPTTLTIFSAPPEELNPNANFIDSLMAKSLLSDLECGVANSTSTSTGTIGGQVGGVTVTPGGSTDGSTTLPVPVFSLVYETPMKVRESYNRFKPQLTTWKTNFCGQNAYCTQATATLAPNFWQNLSADQYRVQFRYCPCLNCGEGTDGGSGGSVGTLRFNKN